MKFGEEGISGLPLPVKSTTYCTSSMPDKFAATTTLNKRLSTIVGYDQLSLSIHSALATGARGIQIQSLSRLDQTDADTLQRVRILQRINNELTTISPWVSGGVSEGEVQVSRDDITVYMTKTDRARLLWVFKNEPDQQIVSKPTDQQIVEFTISGIQSPANHIM